MDYLRHIVFVTCMSVLRAFQHSDDRLKLSDDHT